MKLRVKILAIAAIAVTTFPVVSCAGPASFSYQNVGITISALVSNGITGQYGLPIIPYNPALPQPPNPGSALLMPNAGQGGVIELVANVTNASAQNVQWAIYPQPNLSGITILPNGTGIPVGENGPSNGFFNTPAGTTTTASGPTVYYNQSGVPVYSGQALAQAQAMGIPQGDVMILATLQPDPGNPSYVVTQSQLLQIYGGGTAQGPPSAYLTPHTPTAPSGLVNPVVSVAHNPSYPTIATNGQYQFYGGIVGAAPCLTTGNCNINGVQYPLYTTYNNAVWEVGPTPFSLSTAFPCTVTGPACPFGTVSSTGLYTAPTAIPPTPSGGTANEVVVVLVSGLVGTVDQYAYVGLY